MSQATQTAALHDCRRAFADTLIALAREDERIVAVCNDSVGSSNLTTFKAQFPDRMINVGIGDRNLVGVAAGLANGGLIPFVSAAAPFLTGRALEQIKVDVAYSQARARRRRQAGRRVERSKIYPGCAPSPASQWSIPADPAQTVQAVRWAAANLGPSYVRIPRFPVPDVTPPGSPFLPGQAIQLTVGNDITIIAAGTMVSEASGRVAAPRRHPGTCPEHHLRRAARYRCHPDRGRPDRRDRHRRGGHHHRRSGRSGGDADRAAPERRRSKFSACRALFAPTGSTAFLLEHFGLTAEQIAAAARDIMAHAAR